MSWQATTAVTKYSKAKGTDRLVMLCLANYAGARGENIWPSVPAIMADTLLSKRAVQYSIKRLVNDYKELTVEKRQREDGGDKSNRYKILLPIEGVNSTAVEGDSNTPTRGVQTLHPGGVQTHAPRGCTETYRNKEEHPSEYPEVLKPSRSQGSHVSTPKKFDADPRHKAFKEIVIHVHSCANGMERELVPWDGREGTALAGLLKEKPAMTEEHAKRCVKNFYNSDTDIAARPGGKAGVIRRMLEFWHEKNQFGTPRFMDKDWVKQQRMHSEASVGSYRGE